MNTQIIAITNQKGGVGKTTTCANLGIGLAQAGKKVLLIDGDPQGSLTISLGHPQPDKLPFTLSDAMGRILMDKPLRPGEGILHHPEGVDLMPADIQLSGMEVSLVNAMSRETILRQYLDTVKGQYSHIINYAKTRDTYVAYRKAGYSKKFREEHEEEILLHQAAKNAFDDTELVYVTVVILQDLFHGPGVTGAGRLDHCKGQRLLISGLLHSAIPPVSLVLMVSSVLVLCRWTALRDIPTTAPISPSVSSRTQCSIKMLCPGWGKLAKAAATSPSLI